MSEMSLPGVERPYNTPEIRRGLLGREYQRLDNLEEDQKQFLNKRAALQTYNLRLQAFNNAARKLSAIDGPFRRMQSSSSDPTVATIESLMGASPANHNLKVQQLAKADVFSSKELSPAPAVPSGLYAFSAGTGEEAVRMEFSFSGGSLQDFAAALSSQEDSFIKANVETLANGSSKLTLSSQKTGEAFPLSFDSPDALLLAQNLGILSKKTVSFTADLETLSTSQASTYNTITYDPSRQSALLDPGSEFFIPVPENFALTEQSRAIIDYSLEKFSPQSSNSIGNLNPDSVTYENVTVFNDTSGLNLGPQGTTSNFIGKEELHAFFAYGQGQKKALTPLIVSEEKQTQSSIITQLTDLKDLEELILENTSDDKRIIIHRIAIEEPRSRNGHLPENALSRTQDALFNLDGQDIRRDSNIIDDLIPGSTLSLHGTSEKAVQVKVEPDYKEIEDSISALVGAYNEVIAQTNIMTQYKAPNDTAEAGVEIIEELTYLSPEEKKRAYDYLGTYQGDSTFNSVKDRLQYIFFQNYATSDKAIQGIINLGISTSGPNSTPGTTRRRYLDIDFKKLQDALQDHFQGSRELFNFDSDDEDTLPDTGIAQEAYQFANPYVRFEGILTQRIKQLDENIQRQSNRVSDYKELIQERDEKLKEELRVLEVNLQELETLTRSIDSLQVRKR